MQTRTVLVSVTHMCHIKVSWFAECSCGFFLSHSSPLQEQKKQVLKRLNAKVQSRFSEMIAACEEFPEKTTRFTCDVKKHKEQNW